MTHVVALVAARNEAGRVGETVRAIRRIPEVDEVVVAVDGSSDGTEAEAAEAGARVLVAPGNLGKGGALEGALRRMPPADVYLFLDGDLGASAERATALLEPVLAGRADLAIAAFPRDARHGGFRLVKRLAAASVRLLTGFRPEEPLSGQRAATRAVVETCRPISPGFGVEVGMTIDAVRLGFRVVEVPVEMEHAYTGRDLAGFLHRGKQGLDVLRAAVPRALTAR